MVSTAKLKQKSFQTAITTVAISVVMFIASSKAFASSISILNNGGFEDVAQILPSARRLSWDSSAYGKWAVGDPMRAISGNSGITAAEGIYMLEFLPTTGNSSEVFQVVDVTAYAAAIDSGIVSVNLTASYNAGPGTRLSTNMTIGRYSSAPTGFTGSGFAPLASSEALVLDDEETTWQQISLNNVQLTQGTRYLLFGLGYSSNSSQIYADNASMLLVTSVPEPHTNVLLLGGMAVMLAFVRRLRADLA